jgi:hypothetical protein
MIEDSAPQALPCKPLFRHTADTKYEGVQPGGAIHEQSEVR